MNNLQRLASNTMLAFLSNIVVKASSALLFILVGRRLGPAEAGVFNLGVTYFTLALALSAWGLHELIVREVAPRRGESKQYLLHYLAMRLLLAAGAYGLLLLWLRLNLPYTAHTKAVIHVFVLAMFPEAIFSLLQGLFAAHERLLPPLLAALVNGGVKLGIGLWVLAHDGDALGLAWAIVVGSTVSLLVFIPALHRLFRQVAPQPVRFSRHFALSQLRLTPGFVVIGIFTTIDYQLDAFLISLFLSESELGWYGAAQTIMLAFWMMPTALRTALYPVIARYYYEAPERLPVLYRRANRYVLIGVLPVCAGITLIAPNIIPLIFEADFQPATPALQLIIWAVLPSFLMVPSARLLVVANRQSDVGWVTALSMIINLLLNLWLIPRWGINGAAAARVLATTFFFIAIYAYVQRRLLRDSVLPLLPRPLLATLLMTAAVWPLRHLFVLWPIMVGILVYILALFLLRAIPAEDQQLLRRLKTSAN